MKSYTSVILNQLQAKEANPHCGSWYRDQRQQEIDCTLNLSVGGGEYWVAWKHTYICLWACVCGTKATTFVDLFHKDENDWGWCMEAIDMIEFQYRLWNNHCTQPVFVCVYRCVDIHNVQQMFPSSYHLLSSVPSLSLPPFNLSGCDSIYLMKNS